MSRVAILLSWLLTASVIWIKTFGRTRFAESIRLLQRLTVSLLATPMFKKTGTSITSLSQVGILAKALERR